MTNKKVPGCQHEYVCRTVQEPLKSGAVLLIGIATCQLCGDEIDCPAGKEHMHG